MVATTSGYGGKIRAYLNATPKLKSPWVKVVIEPVVVSNADAWQGSWTQRDTVALCKESSHRRVLCGVNWPVRGILLGRDVEPCVGMTVRLTEQGLGRRIRGRAGGALGVTAEHWKAKQKVLKRDWTGDDDGLHETGVVIRVCGTWTCDVRWSNGQTGSGYACGGGGGKGGRAFHLELLEPVSRTRPNILGEDDFQKMVRKQIGAKCQILR